MNLNRESPAYERAHQKEDDMEDEDMIESEYDVYMYASLSDAILALEMPDWKKWLLRKLIPSEFMAIPPQTIAKLLPGTVIGKCVIHSSQEPDGEIDFGQNGLHDDPLENLRGMIGKKLVVTAKP